MTSASADRHAEYDKGKLFVLSVIALVTAGISFSLRSSVAEVLRTTFFDPIDKLHSAEMIGGALGVAFLGFAFTIAVASPVLDNLGIGRVLQASSLCFIVGTLGRDLRRRPPGPPRHLPDDLARHAPDRGGLGPGRDRDQPSRRHPLPRGQDPPPERAARVVADGDHHRRPRGPGRRASST